MKKLLTAILATIALSACSSTTSTQYYSLPDSQFELPQGKGKEIAVEIVLAEPLNNGGLVYQTDSLSLNFARNNLWASPLDQALAASFANKLNRRHTSYRYVPANRSDSNQVLKIYIEAFNGSYQGKTLVKGYAIQSHGYGKNFNVETPQQGDGYPAMIRSLDEGIESVTAILSN